MVPTVQPGVVAQVQAVEDQIQEAVGTAITFLPRLIGAVLILLIGWIIGRAFGRIVERLVDRAEIDRMVLDTPLGEVLGGTERAVEHTFGVITRWFVYALAILAAADVLAIAVLSQWINTAVSYLPAFVAGLLVIILGFVVADFVGDAIRRTQAATRTRYTDWFASGVQLFLYFVVIVIGLDTMGVNVGILFVFARALAWGLAAAIALGLGIGFGLGSKEYVEENIDRWARQSRSEVAASEGGGRETGAGSSSDAGTGPPGDRPPE